MNKIRIVLADDHGLVRAGIRALLEQMHGVEVLGEADNGREAIELCREKDPDIVVLDIAMPELNGLEALSRISNDYPRTRAILLTMHANEEYVLRALNAGVAGYLLKDSALAELELAIRAVARGETYLSPRISHCVIQNYRDRTLSGEGPLDSLTGRQKEILQLIAEGKTTKEIAQVLNISPKTVETHRVRIMERLSLHDIAALVRFSVCHGLVTCDG